jgi:phosphatidate cytidylyltransferase
MNEFWKRTITGIVFVSVLIGSILWNQWAFMILFGIINLLCLYEFYGLLIENKGLKSMGLLASAIIFVFASPLHKFIFPEQQFIFVYLAVPIIFIAFFLIIFDRKNNPIAESANLVFGLIYITLPFTLFSLIPSYTSEYRKEFLLAPLIFVWVNDTCAYLTGMLTGKHKFFERLSPKKTWEGVAGGVLFTLYFSVVVWLLFKTTNWIDWFFIALISSIGAISGDLFESLLKRRLKIKDTGKIFPGHGGFLDRFDALLFLIPFYFLYLILAVF